VVDDGFVRLTDRPCVAARQAGEVPDGISHEAAVVRRRTEGVSLTGRASLGWHGGSPTLRVRGSGLLSESEQSTRAVLKLYLFRGGWLAGHFGDEPDRPGRVTLGAVPDVAARTAVVVHKRLVAGEWEPDALTSAIRAGLRRRHARMVRQASGLPLYPIAQPPTSSLSAQSKRVRSRCSGRSTLGHRGSWIRRGDSGSDTSGKDVGASADHLTRDWGIPASALVVTRPNRDGKSGEVLSLAYGLLGRLGLRLARSSATRRPA
jgi:hypothetical protein